MIGRAVHVGRQLALTAAAAAGSPAPSAARAAACSHYAASSVRAAVAGSALRRPRVRCFSSKAVEPADDDDADVAGGVTPHPPAELASDFGSALKPREVVEQLDKYIVGQADAKRAVAIALRNRWRRHRLADDIKNEVIPKNILMIGPTGCGKTEIARRIAKLSQAPFIKVEATKFTEVGFHGRDVDQIIRDLVEIAITMVKKAKMEKLKSEAREKAMNTILNALAGPTDNITRQSLHKQLLEGNLGDRKVQVDVPADRGATNNLMLDPNNVVSGLSAVFNIGKLAGGAGKRMDKKDMTVKDALPLLEEVHLDEMVDMADVAKEAVAAVEQDGIVFIDEIDKICNTSDYRGADASAEGVQRDLLPLIEGSSISTKYGNINTDYILFIGSGAFSQCKPSDLLAELQGRLPIRVELKGLTEDDMYRILTEPVTNIIRQQKELLAAEEVDLVFEDSAVREVARVAAQVNRTVENIGARRLHTVLERVVEEISFDASDSPPGTTITVTPELVRTRVSDMLIDSDLSKYIL